MSTAAEAAGSSFEEQELDFAPDFDAPVPYMKRTRDYYLALGYDNPYRWANHTETPFTELSKPLGESTVGFITTAAPFRPELGDQGPGAAYNAAAKFYKVFALPTDDDPDFRISHLGYDRKHTTAADINTYFPLRELKRRAANGDFGKLSDRFYGAPTNRSQRQTVTVDCPEILAHCREDGVDVAVVVAN
jgi:hypothetical protein